MSASLHVPLTFGKAVRLHRCYSTDIKCFVCGRFLADRPAPSTRQNTDYPTQPGADQ